MLHYSNQHDSDSVQTGAGALMYYFTKVKKFTDLTPNISVNLGITRNSERKGNGSCIHPSLYKVHVCIVPLQSGLFQRQE